MLKQSLFGVSLAAVFLTTVFIFYVTFPQSLEGVSSIGFLAAEVTEKVEATGLVGCICVLLSAIAMVALSAYRPRTLWKLSVAALVYYVVAVVILHIREPVIDPIQIPMSFYCVTETGWLMTTTFFALAVSLLAFALVMTTSYRDRIVWWLCAIGLASTAAGVFLGGVYPTDPVLPHETMTGALHAHAAIFTQPASLGLPVIATWFIRRRIQNKIADRVLVVATAVIILNFVVNMVILAAELFLGWGLLQRVYVLTYFVWLVVATSTIDSVRQADNPLAKTSS